MNVPRSRLLSKTEEVQLLPFAVVILTVLAALLRGLLLAQVLLVSAALVLRRRGEWHGDAHITVGARDGGTEGREGLGERERERERESEWEGERKRH